MLCRLQQFHADGVPLTDGDSARLVAIESIATRDALWNDIGRDNGTVVPQMCPGAVQVADPSHIVERATDAIDERRRVALNDTRKQARAEPQRGRGRPAKMRRHGPAASEPSH